MVLSFVLFWSSACISYLDIHFNQTIIYSKSRNQVAVLSSYYYLVWLVFYAVSTTAGYWLFLGCTSKNIFSIILVQSFYFITWAFFFVYFLIKFFLTRNNIFKKNRSIFTIYSSMFLCLTGSGVNNPMLHLLINIMIVIISLWA